jgi:hypothetical protein
MVIYKKTRMKIPGLYQVTYIHIKAHFKAELELNTSHEP